MGSALGLRAGGAFFVSCRGRVSMAVVSKWLEEKVEETKKMLAVRKAHVAEAIATGTDTPQTSSELGAISDLETRVANMEFIAAANERTRRGGPSHGGTTPKAGRTTRPRGKGRAQAGS